MKIGFIGLGIMGFPMAVHLLRAGVELIVSDINPEAVARAVEEGAKPGNNPEIGKQCGIVITMVPAGSNVREILFGEEGIADMLQPGSIVCDMSSILPEESKEFNRKLQERGIAFLDAPVSGGEEGAVSASLSIMVGGDEEAYQKMIPYFEIMGGTHVRIGGSGSGSITKLANQIIVNNTIAAVSEAMVFSVKAGVDPMRVYQAIRGGLAGSMVLDTKAPKMISGDFEPGGSLLINRKDIGNVVKQAHFLDVPVPYTAQLFEIMQTLKNHDLLDRDHSAIVQYFEELAGTKVMEFQEDAR